ncbi:hypothetical protein ACJJIW_14900 [Microbulbifer sp. JMSA004]|uniref:hypothetical protein n=1 Tax=unclassified Microbulbifer TaxID=2619833 RepID=UPI0024AD4F31|nr:hypothetical protein [Microbulbifer sp. VAAF005]WHI47709.1 hypothetical protein P0078_04770 [Microbulbifer sp. VAAF005]
MSDTFRDRLSGKVVDQMATSAALSLHLDSLRDLSALSKLQVREFTHTGATQMQATANSILQMSAVSVRTVNQLI